MEKNHEIEDNGGILWTIIGCCIPQISLALYFILKDRKPKRAKALAAGTCITLCVLILVIVYTLFENYLLM